MHMHCIAVPTYVHTLKMCTAWVHKWVILIDIKGRNRLLPLLFGPVRQHLPDFFVCFQLKALPGASAGFKIFNMHPVI
jgi:hypothetical protein